MNTIKVVNPQKPEKRPAVTTLVLDQLRHNRGALLIIAIVIITVKISMLNAPNRFTRFFFFMLCDK